MKLSFKERHLSITSFPDIEIPPLTIILGINGSGKTHLLQAIANGNIANDAVPIEPNRMGGQPHANGGIKLLQSGQATAMDANAYSPAAPNSHPGAAHDGFHFDRMRHAVLQPFFEKLESLTGGRLSQILLAGEDVWRLGPVEVVRRVGDDSLEAAVAAIFAEASEAIPTANKLAAKNPVFFSGPGTELLVESPRIAAKLGVSVLELTDAQAQQFSRWGNTDQFHPNIAMVFGRYRDAMIRNRLMRMEDEDKGVSTALSDDDFVKHFGRPPWIQLTETLAAFGLPYEAIAPNLYDFSVVSFGLAKIPSGDPVTFHNLSSGEKVLLQFAISSFEYDEDRIQVSRPALLLLDEMDAALHPEMVHRWLGAVGDGLVAKQGIPCVITTHSPTTVALAPEEALFEMRDGRSGLTKISKQDALNKLTFGVPTLSIDYSGRRQVFAESDTDAAIYERVYSLVKSQLSCARALNFLSTGMRTKDGGEINSGCTIVKNIVQSLHDAGNRAVYGIVDWDGSAVSTDRVKVIAEGIRDGIESILLDPLLVCLLLMKLRRAPAGMEDIDRFVGADALDEPDLQRMADAVQYAVFPSSTSHKVQVAFIGGAKINVLHEYITANDHDLEAALVDSFPALNKWASRGRGELVKAVVEEVLTEHRTFCPIELKTIFEAIANAPA